MCDIFCVDDKVGESTQTWKPEYGSKKGTQFLMPLTNQLGVTDLDACYIGQNGLASYIASAYEKKMGIEEKDCD